MSRRRKLRLLVAVLLSSLFVGIAGAATDVSVDGDTITITVKIDFGNTTQRNANRIARVFERFFNNGPGSGGYEFCGMELEFEADVRAVPPGEARTDAHFVWIEPVRPGVNLNAYVQWPRDDWDPTEENANGDWHEDLPDSGIAHEFGHLLGLDDQYTVDTGPDGERDPEDATPVTPGHEGTLMGDTSGPLLQSEIDEIVSRHLQGFDLGCEVWEGTIDSVVTTQGPGGPCGNRIPVTGTSRLVVAADGSVTGTYDVTGCGVTEPHADFTGTANDRQFHFPALYVFTNREPIPKVSSTHAEGTFTNQQGPNTTWVTTWDLDCTSCATG